MAEPNLPPELEALDLELPDAHDPRSNPGASNLNGLDDWQRWVVKNIFDTQPAKRKSYMKRLGYELGEDNESYRPIGSDGSFQPIEPGEDSVLSWIAAHNLFTEKGRAEVMRDFADVGYDTLVAAPMITAAGAKGAAGGAAAMGLTGAAVGMPLAAPSALF
jgi:hypothetical protein